MLPLDKASIFCDGLDHPECVAAHPDGSLWAGGEAGQIYRIEPDGSAVEEVARADGGFMLGVAISPDANWLVACDLYHQCLWRLDLASGRLSEFSRGPADGAPFSNPNYAAFDRDSRLYVSDSGRAKRNDGRIIRFDPEGRGQVWHAGPLEFANGIALSPGGDALYVVCSFRPGIEKIAIRTDDTAGERSTVVEIPRTVPDGIAFDEEGRLYISCYTPARIYRLADPDERPTERSEAQPDPTPAGAPMGRARDDDLEVFIDDWEAHTLANPTNIAFGGPGFDQLFVANLGRWHITRIDAGVRGAPLPCHDSSRRPPTTLP